LDYRLNVDTDIVGIANIDNTVVIGTKSFPYLAFGNDPAAYSMSKLEVPQACVAKRSFAYLVGIGVVFASPDGLIAIAGTGQVRNLTETVFTRHQWQALEPETIIGVAHDDVYHFWYGVAVPVDTLFANVVLLLNPTDQSNGSSNILDYSAYAHPMTLNGTTITTSVSGPFGGGAINCVSTWLNTPNIGTELTMGTGDFTWEGWVRLSSVPTSVGWLLYNGNSTAFSGRAGIGFGPTINGGIAWYLNGSATAAQTGVAPTVGVWHFVAYSRNSGVGRLYVDGVFVGSIADTTNYPLVGTQGIGVGADGQGGNVLTGYVGPVRVTKGVGRYPSTCTVPTAPFPISA
jgi:hypothetical protein